MGLRTDHAWRSWRLIAELWGQYLRRDGAAVITVEGSTEVGAAGGVEREMIEDLATKVDCAIVGLGTCGSCTTYTVRDAVIVENTAKPVVAMICDEFLVHAQHLAADLRHGELEICVLLYPLRSKPDPRRSYA